MECEKAANWMQFSKNEIDFLDEEADLWRNWIKSENIDGIDILLGWWFYFLFQKCVINAVVVDVVMVLLFNCYYLTI